MELKRKGEEAPDIDQMLTKDALDSLEGSFWARYKMSWPVEVSPADALMSRVARELANRQ